MKRLFGKRKRQDVPVPTNKPHLVVKMEDPKPKPVEMLTEGYPLEKIAEFKKLGKRPYRNGKLTQTFKTWYDDNRT